MNEKWIWSDGWILMSVYLVANDIGSELSDIIAAADATNHAIPTSREFSSSLTKLTQHGIVEKNDDKYKIGHSYLDEIERAYKAKGGLFESANKGLKWLNRTNLSCINNLEVIISDEKLTSEYQAYLKKTR